MYDIIAICFAPNNARILVTKNILSLSFPSVFFLYLNAFLIIILVSHDMQTNSLQVELVCISSLL